MRERVTGIREAREAIDDGLSCVVCLALGTRGGVLVADVAVQIDQRRNNRLAPHVDTGGVRGRRDLTDPAYPGQPAAFYDDGRVLDDRSTVSDDDAGALEDRQLRCRRGLCATTNPGARCF